MPSIISSGEGLTEGDRRIWLVFNRNSGVELVLGNGLPFVQEGVEELTFSNKVGVKEECETGTSDILEDELQGKGVESNTGEFEGSVKDNVTLGWVTFLSEVSHASVLDVSGVD